MSPIEGLREFTQDDYPALGELFDAVLPEYPGLGEEIRRDDGHIKPPARYKRWLVERGGMAVAMTDYHQHNRLYHPRKYFVEINVHPDWRRKGIGQSLYTHLLEEMASLDPWLLRIESREDLLESTRLLEKYGYKAVQRYEEWRLDIEAYKAEAFEADAVKVEDGGIRIASLAELSSDPEWKRRFYELREPLLEDVPNVDARTPATFEEFEERYFSNPNFISDGVFIALDGEDWVALTELSYADDPESLWVGLSAVKAEYRGRSLATAVKVRSLQWALGTGRKVLITWNEEGNSPMLGINKRLGFEPRPAWITWEKEVGVKGADD
ncbi:GNAT family N-acetyltransferase [bacterium]|nr:GNAT family N-acetyltransferase [bacterium]